MNMTFTIIAALLAVLFKEVCKWMLILSIVLLIIKFLNWMFAKDEPVPVPVEKPVPKTNQQIYFIRRSDKYLEYIDDLFEHRNYELNEKIWMVEDDILPMYEFKNVPCITREEGGATNVYVRLYNSKLEYVGYVPRLGIKGKRFEVRTYGGKCWTSDDRGRVTDSIFQDYELYLHVYD